jgi:hypothetical protein
MTENKFKKGDFVEIDGLIGVVVGIEKDEITPEGHLAIWFGAGQQVRASEGATSPIPVEIHTVPIAMCGKLKQTPTIFH